MSLLTDKGTWEPEYVSVFQFINLFRGKRVTSFLENLAHEGSNDSLQYVVHSFS